MEPILQKLLDWLWAVCAAVFWVFWTKLSRMEGKLARTREEMVNRNELASLTAALSNVRETRMTRDEMIEALRGIKTDTDQKLDKIAEKMEATQQKLIDSETRTSQFRHDMRDQIHAQSLNIRLIAQKGGIDIAPPDGR